MLERLVTESRNPRTESIDGMSALDIVEAMSAEDSLVASAVAAQSASIAAAIELVAERFRRGGRLIYVGAGTSGRLGVLDASECPPTFNCPPGQVVGLIAGGHTALTTAVEGAEDKPALAAEDLDSVKLGPLDVLVGIATSGRTPYVIAALRLGRERGAATIAITCNSDTEISQLAEVSIETVVGPEVISGSTRLKAGTATKMVLNMLSTGAMVLIGKTYSNLMVDLRATNSKLRVRTQQIVRQLTNLDDAEATSLLDQCDGELKTAVIAGRLGLQPAEARKRLSEAGGHLRRALEAGAGGHVIRYADLVLGVDAGGTSTEAVLARCGGAEITILARGFAGPANPHVVGFAAAMRTIGQAVGEAFQAAKLKPGPVRHACLAVAGAGRDHEQRRIKKAAEGAGLAEGIDVVDDAVPLFAAGTPGGWGLVLIAGTGSLARGRTKDGRTARAGGWGYLLGDEGSGYSLGLAALNAITKALDGRAEKSVLVESCLRKLGISTAELLIERVYGQPIPRESIVALAECVVTAAEQGDAFATTLLHRASQELALMLHAVARSLDFVGQPVPLAMAGGLLVGSSLLRSQVLEQCAGMQLCFESIAVVASPAEGSAKLAASVCNQSSAR